MSESALIGLFFAQTQHVAEPAQLHTATSQATSPTSTLTTQTTQTTQITQTTPPALRNSQPPRPSAKTPRIYRAPPRTQSTPPTFIGRIAPRIPLVHGLSAQKPHPQYLSDINPDGVVLRYVAPRSENHHEELRAFCRLIPVLMRSMPTPTHPALLIVVAQNTPMHLPFYRSIFPALRIVVCSPKVIPLNFNPIRNTDHIVRSFSALLYSKNTVAGGCASIFSASQSNPPTTWATRGTYQTITQMEENLRHIQRRDLDFVDRIMQLLMQELPPILLIEDYFESYHAMFLRDIASEFRRYTQGNVILDMNGELDQSEITNLVMRNNIDNFQLAEEFVAESAPIAPVYSSALQWMWRDIIAPDYSIMHLDEHPIVPQLERWAQLRPFREAIEHARAIDIDIIDDHAHRIIRILDTDAINLDVFAPVNSTATHVVAKLRNDVQPTTTIATQEYRARVQTYNMNIRPWGHHSLTPHELDTIPSRLSFNNSYNMWVFINNIHRYFTKYRVIPRAPNATYITSTQSNQQYPFISTNDAPIPFSANNRLRRYPITTFAAYFLCASKLMPPN